MKLKIYLDTAVDMGGRYSDVFIVDEVCLEKHQFFAVCHLDGEIYIINKRIIDLIKSIKE